MSAARPGSRWARLSPGRGARFIALLGLLGTASPLDAQAGRSDSVSVRPRGNYDAGAIHRLLLGGNYRDLWSLAIEVEVLDVDRFAGGLVPTRLGGGQQTQSLRFRGRDGREYTFRSIDKDASRTLDPALRNSIASRVLQDQISALLPASSLVVSPLLEAAGVLHAEPRLVAMPDDPRLGEFREAFGGLLGLIEERPDEGPDGEPGFAGASRVVRTETLFDRLEDDPRHRLDDRGFLLARLVDAFVGDWDRHADQWQWAGFDEAGGTRWLPIPRDRDWALARIEGWLPAAAGLAFPNYVGFGHDFPSAFRLGWSGRVLDRRLLSATSESTWVDVAAGLANRLTDEAIDRAVRRLPAAYYQRIGRDLTSALVNRRDRLPEFAREYYRLLAGWVDVHATDRDEIAVVERLDGDRVRVEIAVRSGNEPAASPHFARTFHARDTREVRIFLHGGDDRLAVSGSASGRIRIRVIGGGGDDRLADLTAGRNVLLYDDRGDNVFEPGPATHLDRSAWDQPVDASGAPVRDWGSFAVPFPVLSYEPDLGLSVGAGLLRWGYGFRYAPWKSRLVASGSYGTGARRFSGQIGYDTPLKGQLRGRFTLRYSALDRRFFYGFGNETTEDRDRSFYRANRSEVTASASVAVRPVDALDLSVGPILRRIRPFGTAATLLDSLGAYGAGDFDQAGITARMTFDSRTPRLAAHRGLRLDLHARFLPAWLDVEEPFGGIRAEAAVFLSPREPPSPVLALRAGGEKVWGRIPYHEAAYVGGSETVRGFANQRFAGDAAVFANAELRLPVAAFFLTLPGHFGVFGLADAGRVRLSGQSSDEWHTAAGGGIWVSFLQPGNTVSVGFARSRERIGTYVRAGFLF